MGFIYLNKFTYLNTFVIQLAQRCLDNRGPIVYTMYLVTFHVVLTTGAAHKDDCNLDDSVWISVPCLQCY